MIYKILERDIKMGVEVAIRNYEDALIGRRRFSLKIPGYLERKPIKKKGLLKI